MLVVDQEEMGLRHAIRGLSVVCGADVLCVGVCVCVCCRDLSVAAEHRAVGQNNSSRADSFDNSHTHTQAHKHSLHCQAYLSALPGNRLRGVVGRRRRQWGE